MFQQGKRQPIIVDVSPKTVGDTTVMQRVQYLSHTNAQDAHGVCSVVMKVRVLAYALENGGYGDRLDVLWPPNEPTLHADNRTIVNAATGELLRIRGLETDGQWQAIQDDYAADPAIVAMLQGDYAEELRGVARPNSDEDMIRYYIQHADAAGRFA